MGMFYRRPRSRSDERFDLGNFYRYTDFGVSVEELLNRKSSYKQLLIGALLHTLLLAVTFSSNLLMLVGTGS